MGLNIKKAEVDYRGKNLLFLADQEKEIAFLGGGVIVDHGDGVIESWPFCPCHIVYDDVPDIIEAPGIVEAS